MKYARLVTILSTSLLTAANLVLMPMDARANMPPSSTSQSDSNDREDLVRACTNESIELTDTLIQFAKDNKEALGDKIQVPEDFDDIEKTHKGIRRICTENPEEILEKTREQRAQLIAGAVYETTFSPDYKKNIKTINYSAFKRLGFIVLTPNGPNRSNPKAPVPGDGTAHP